MNLRRAVSLVLSIIAILFCCVVAGFFLIFRGFVEQGTSAGTSSVESFAYGWQYMTMALLLANGSVMFVLARKHRFVDYIWLVILSVSTIFIQKITNGVGPVSVALLIVGLLGWLIVRLLDHEQSNLS